MNQSPTLLDKVGINILYFGLFFGLGIYVVMMHDSKLLTLFDCNLFVAAIILPKRNLLSNIVCTAIVIAVTLYDLTARPIDFQQTLFEFDRNKFFLAVQIGGGIGLLAGNSIRLGIALCEQSTKRFCTKK